jgi:hypothetical protein
MIIKELKWAFYFQTKMVFDIHFNTIYNNKYKVVICFIDGRFMFSKATINQ